MKKILLAMFAVLAMSLAANATLVMWGLTDQAKFDGTPLGGALCELYFVGQDEDVKIDFKRTKQAGEGVPVFLIGKLGTGCSDYQTPFKVNDTIAGTVADANASIYMKIYNTDDQGIQWVNKSENMKLEGLSETMAATANFQMNWEKGEGGWVQQVPEPTSIALLVIGVAAFALRRKHI